MTEPTPLTREIMAGFGKTLLEGYGYEVTFKDLWSQEPPGPTPEPEPEPQPPEPEPLPPEPEPSMSRLSAAAVNLAKTGKFVRYNESLSGGAHVHT